MLGQEQNIVAPLAQGRQVERHHAEAKEQIGAKPLLRANSAKSWLVEANSRTAACSSSAGSKRGLGGRSRVADFVEEKGPAREPSGQDCPVCHLGHCRPTLPTADRHERPLGPSAARGVDRLGEGLSAAASFSPDQNGQIGIGHAASDRPQGLNRRTLADQRRQGLTKQNSHSDNTLARVNHSDNSSQRNLFTKQRDKKTRKHENQIPFCVFAFVIPMMPASVVCFAKDIILKYFRTQQREKHPPKNVATARTRLT